MPVIDRMLAVGEQGVSSPYLEKRIGEWRTAIRRLSSSLARSREVLAEQTIDAPMNRDLGAVEAALQALVEVHEEVQKELIAWQTAP